MLDALASNRAAPLGQIDDRKTDQGARVRRAAALQNSISFDLVRIIARGGEFALIALVGLIVSALYLPSGLVISAPHYIVVFLATALTTILVFDGFGLYTRPALSSALPQLTRVVTGWTIAMALTIGALFFFKAGAEFSRASVALWFVVTGVCLIGARITFAHFIDRLVRRGQLVRRAVIYGGGNAGVELIEALEADPYSDVIVCGVFDDRGDERVPQIVAGYPKLGRLDDLVTFCRANRVDVILLSLPLSAETKLLEISRLLWVLPVDIRLAMNATKLQLRPRAYSHVGNVPVLDLYDKPLTDWNALTKALFDKVIAALALVAFSPLMLATAVAIRRDSKGPILFKQKRYGFNNELIEVYKFRSMYTDMTDAKAAKLVTRDDPRVTPVGRFIRKSSIDELPQLFNVLRGELSLVGPRPHALQAKAADKLYDEAVEGYFARHRVKPGITGWAQINGWRGETDTHEKIEKRVECDLYYIENWSLWLDIYILLRTPLSLVSSKNAY